MEFLGDIERFVFNLYPYRWAFFAGLVIALAVMAIWGYRRGWHLAVWQHRKIAAIVGTPALVVVIIGGYYLGSPFFTSQTVDEELPFAFDATIPANMTSSEVMAVMGGMGKVTQEVNEAMPESMLPRIASGVVNNQTMQRSPVVLKTGDFRDADNFHMGSGNATIYRGPGGSLLLRLENFKVTNGPDLHVLLTSHPNPTSRGDIKGAGYVDLGKLKGNQGNQNYAIPDDVDISAQMSVVIYCMPFHVVFSVATLHVPS
jgi:hypothetical protein